MRIGSPGDYDLIQAFCTGGGLCVGDRYASRILSGFYQVDWSIVGGPEDLGGFMDETGQAVDGAGAWRRSVSNRSVVLYVPPSPSSFACDDYRIFTIRAAVHDGSQLQAGLRDGAIIYSFNAFLWRSPGTNSLGILIETPTITTPPPSIHPEGADEGGLCNPLVPFLDATGIDVDPKYNRFVGLRESRPLIVDYFDLDAVNLYCNEPPNGCSDSILAPIQYRDRLSYLWEIDISGGPAPAGVMILPGTERENVAILVVGDEVGEVRIKVTVDDSGTGADETADEKSFTVRILDLHFLSQSNEHVPHETTGPASDLNGACLQVSQVRTDFKINSDSTATWDGPTTGSDSRTYRVEVDSTYSNAPALGSPIVRLIKQSVPWNHFDVPYSEALNCKNSLEQSAGSAPFRNLGAVPAGVQCRPWTR
jgi:hypothetical protein